MRIPLFFLIVAVFSLAFSDGVIIPPEPVGPEKYPVRLLEHEVHMRIEKGIAVIEIDEIFYNELSRVVDAIYIFPIPKGAVVSDFTMEVDGETLEAEVLPKDEARKEFMKLVSKLMDPALLEYADEDILKLEIAPLQPHEKRRISLRYTQVLEREGDILKLVYPLKIDSIGGNEIGKLRIYGSFSGEVSDLYSPTNDVEWVRDEEGLKFKISEDEFVAKSDVVLMFSVPVKELGIGIETYKPFRDEPGTFMLTLVPPLENAKPVPKHLIFVLDTSGSMSGYKMESAKRALDYVASHLNPGDEFSVVLFSSRVRVLAERRRPEDYEEIREAIMNINASGGTNINDALRVALELSGESNLSPYVIFLTDGLPTVGVVEIKDIIENVANWNRHGAHLFVFGVGEDLNTSLLNSLAQRNGGLVEYVLDPENLETAISRFYEDIKTPVMESPKVEISGDMEIRKVVPREIPGIFQGRTVRVFGRYRGFGRMTVKLIGKVGGERVVIERTFNLPEVDRTDDFIELIWAKRYVYYLIFLNDVYGPDEERVEEIKELSKRYGILTPETSFLLVEKTKGSGRALGTTNVKTMAKVVSEMRSETLEVKPEKRFVSGKTFVEKDGIWVDTELEGKSVIRIKIFSEAYFKLLEVYPELSEFASLGSVKFKYEDREFFISEIGGIESAEDLMRELSITRKDR